MDKDTQTLYKRITDQMKVLMEALDVVRPRRYALMFSDIAKEQGVDISQEEVMSSEALDDRIVSNVEQLRNSASKAVDAIENKDQVGLQEVLAETKALREEIEELRGIVYEDTLTKVYNRRWMDENYLGSDDGHFDKDGVLVMIDLNDFKYINDTFGHITGDKVLFFIASQLRQSGGDVVRFGGDEFFVLFDEEITIVKARLKLHTIRESVIKRKLNADGQTFKASFSYGVSRFAYGDSIGSIVQLVDEEMYKDKTRIKERLRRTVAA